MQLSKQVIFIDDIKEQHPCYCYVAKHQHTVTPTQRDRISGYAIGEEIYNTNPQI